MARTLILLRHGKSDWSQPVSDRDRPLAKRGRRQAPYSGQWLAEQNIIPNLVIVSPATRAQQTWEHVAEPLTAAATERMRVQTEEWAYTFAGSDLMALLESVPDPVHTVMLVGHNPAFEELVEALTGSYVRIKTSGIAIIDFPHVGFTPGTGTLRYAGRPADPDHDAETDTGDTGDELP